MLTCITPEGIMIEVGLEARLRGLADFSSNDCEIGEMIRNNPFFSRKEVNNMVWSLKGPEDPPEGTIMDDNGDFPT